jgi:hypothetical protein
MTNAARALDILSRAYDGFPGRIPDEREETSLARYRSTPSTLATNPAGMLLRKRTPEGVGGWITTLMLQ